MFTLAILIGIMILICIFPMTNDFGHLFVCLFAYHVSSLMKIHEKHTMGKTFAHLKQIVVFLLLSFENSLYILHSGPFLDK